MMKGRWFDEPFQAALRKPYVHVLFGARQSGKTTLLRRAIPEPSLWFDLSDPSERSRLLERPGEFADACRALPMRRAPHVVVVDEAQSVPALFDAVQHLYDRERSRFRFVLCGSSARRLRGSTANLLPGRAVLHRMFPLVLAEHPPPVDSARSTPLVPLRGEVAPPLFPRSSLIDRLVFGEFPGIVLAPRADRESLLRTFATGHLETELRRESFVKDWGAFARFLRLAAAESGRIVNFAAISREAGVSLPTIRSHYELLEEMFLGFRIDAWSRSSRKQLLSTPRFFFVDLGLRHAAAGLSVTQDTVLADPGPVLEQWVAIELWKRLRYAGRGRLYYFRTKGGAEIDLVVELPNEVLAVEVKWTERPSADDARHLREFLDDPRTGAKRGVIVCRCPRPIRLDDRITAIPWWAL